MNRFLTMKRLGILFVSLFAVITGGTLVFQHFWLDPDRRCAQSGQWYFAEERRCVTPVYIPRITGRAPGVSRAEASDANIREVIQAETEAKRREAALAADTIEQGKKLETSRPGL